MDNQNFFVVEPEQLGFPVTGMTLQERRTHLGELVRTRGAEWAHIRSRMPDFLNTLETLDSFLNTNKELTNSAFENSPYEILPLGSTNDYDPLFGYYSPESVLRFAQLFDQIPPDTLSQWENGPDGDLIGSVIYAFRSAFAEAAKRGHAIAIDYG